MLHRLERRLCGLLAVAALALCAAGPMPDGPGDPAKIERACMKIDAERKPIDDKISSAQTKLNDLAFAQQREEPWTRASDRERREQAIRVVHGYDTLILIWNAEVARQQSKRADVDARYQQCQNRLAAARAEAATQGAGLQGPSDMSALGGSQTLGRPGCVPTGGAQHSMGDGH